MPEALQESAVRIPHKPIMDFYNRVKDIEALYPYLRLIQEQIDEERNRFLCTITVTEQLSTAQEEAFNGAILDLIQAMILPVLPTGFRCQPQDITFVVQQDTSTHSADQKGISAVCRQVEAVFAQDGIHVCFENNTFLVYGAAPRDHSSIRGQITANIPHTMPCIVQFKPGAEWKGTAIDVVEQANEAFAGIGIQGPGVLSGIVLILAKSAGIVRRK